MSYSSVWIRLSGVTVAVITGWIVFCGTIRNFVRGGAVEPIRPWLM
jgi:hypothetical protein